MKYRIVKLQNGNFGIQMKTIFGWRDDPEIGITSVPYASVEEARSAINKIHEKPFIPQVIETYP